VSQASTMSQTATHTQAHFALCTRKGDDDLELRRAYAILPAADNEAGFMRVVDESGEDYLYPSEYFVRLELPPSIEQSFMTT